MVKTKTNRTAVYFFFDKDGIIRDYNLFFINSLKDVAQRILVVSNGQLTEESQKKLKRLNIDIYTRENKGFDVWAYKDAMNYVGWKDIVACDELILCNFTCYGPIYPFQEMFDTMAQRNCDFWGAAKHPEQQNYLLPNNQGWIYEHIMSYFMVIRHNMLVSPYFKEYWDNIPEIKTKTESTAYHETVFTKHFEKLGFKSDAFVDLEKYKGRANNGSIFYANEFLIKDRCPLVKRRAFFFPLYDNILDYSDGHQAKELMDFITNHTSYDENMIWDDILATQPMSTIMNNMHLNCIISNDAIKSSDTSNDVLFIFGIRHRFQIDYLKDYFEKSKINFSYIISYNKEYNAIIRKTFSKLKFKLIDGDKEKNILEQINLSSKQLAMYKTFCCLDIKDMKNPMQISYEDCYKYMLNTLIGNENQIKNIQLKFDDYKRLGFLIPYPVMFGNYENYASSLLRYNANNWPKIYKNLGLTIPYDENLNLLFENCFWGRIELLPILTRSVDEIKNVLPYFYPLFVQQAGFYCSYISSQYGAEISLNNALYRKRQIEKIVFAEQQNNAWQMRALCNKILSGTKVKTIAKTVATNSVLHFRDVKKTIKEYIKQKKQRKRQRKRQVKNQKKYIGNAFLKYVTVNKGRALIHILCGSNLYLQCGIYKYYPKKEISASAQQLLEYYKKYNAIGYFVEIPIAKLKNHPIEAKKSEQEFYKLNWGESLPYYGVYDFAKENLFFRLNSYQIYIEDKLHFYKSVLFSSQYKIKEKLLFLLLKLNPIHKYILFAENGGAGDNSFELFKYAVKRNPNCYYLASKSVISGVQDPLLKKHMVKFNSHRHIWMFFCSHKWIGSYSLRYELFPQKGLIKDILLYNIPAEWIFVPHGMAVGDKNPIMCHKYSWDEPSRIFCCNEYEQQQWAENYEMRNVFASGDPRMDKWYGTKLDDKKIVLFFTWRINLSLMQKDSRFQTPYVKHIIHLVKFIQTKFPQKHIYYVFHHEVVKAGLDEIIKTELGDKNISYIYFNTSEGINEFNQQFKTAKYLITDYSSVAYDFAYKKGSIPICYLNEEFISGHYPLERKFYDIHLGVLTQTFPELEKALKMNAPTAEMKKRKNKFFTYQDNKNCERVYNAIFKEKK